MPDNLPTPAEALDAIDWVCVEAWDYSQPVDDEATLSYRKAVALLHGLRAKIAEIRAVVAEAKLRQAQEAPPVACPPDPIAMLSFRCSFCHRVTEVDPFSSAPALCACGHRCDVPRILCTCQRCVEGFAPPTGAVSKEAADAVAELLASRKGA